MSNEPIPRRTRLAVGEGELQRRLKYGQRLRAVRLAMGYENASDFCRAVNKAAGLPAVATEGIMTSQRLNNYERGRAAPRLGDEVLPVFESMGISISYLVTGNVALLPADIRADVIARLREIRDAGNS